MYFDKTEGRKYLYLRVNEDHVDYKFSDNLDEFREFNHYWSLIHSDKEWELEKKVIEERRISCYVANGNDTHYYIISHPTWVPEFLGDKLPSMNN